ncbi:hypothetical protein B5D77_22380 [Microcystis sp. MC19]|nr:hypothetical protein B5D77_22380 [Microcystis sp. MC19]
MFNFAQSDGFWANLETAFGTSYDVVKATQLRQQWQSRNFSQLPEIEVVSGAVLGTANGAYGISTNKIYLSESFLASASLDALVAVVLEEIGHFVDAQVNAEDSAGDEGEIFSGIVQGKVFESEQLKLLKAEDDHAIVSLDGKLVAIEQAQPVSESGGKGGNKLKVFTLDPLPQGTTERNVTLTYRYEHFSIPDQFELRYGKGKDPLFSTEKPVSGSKAGIVVFKQVQGQDTVNIEVIAPQEGTAWNFTVSDKTAEINVDGKLGDVVKIADADLTKQRGNLTLRSLPDASKGKLIDGKGENATVGNTYEVLYYVPKVTGAIQNYGIDRSGDLGLEQVTFDVEDQDQKSLNVKVSVTDGFSTSGTNLVTFGTDKLDIYRKQQRLAYLGFPDSSGNPLNVNGQSGGNTEWATQLFNIVVNGKSLLERGRISGQSKTLKAYINATNAPEWVSLDQRIANFTFVETQRRFGANFSGDVIQGAITTIGKEIKSTGVSENKGSGGESSTHDGGRGVDIETPGREIVRNRKVPGTFIIPNGQLFFRERRINGTWYVATANNQIIIRDGDVYRAGNPNDNADLNRGLTTNFLVPNGSTILPQISTLLVNNAGYNPQDAINIINAFRGQGVQEILFNDPRTWADGARFSPGHWGHIHFEVPVPAQATLLQNQRSFQLVPFNTPIIAENFENTVIFNNSSSLLDAIDLGTVAGNLNLTGIINAAKPEEYYRLVLGTPVSESEIEGDYYLTLRNFSVFLDGLSDDLDIELIRDYNEDGVRQDEEVITSSEGIGNGSESINLTGLPENIYYIRVFQKSGDTTYNLALTVPPLPVPQDNAGNTANNAENLGILDGNVTRSDFIGAVDSDDYYRFTLDKVSDFSLEINGLDQGNLFVYLGQDSNNDGLIDFDETIAISDNEGNEPEAINVNGLAIGDYIIWLSRNNGNTDYNLNLSATPSVIPTDKAGNTIATAFNLGTLTASTQNDFVGNVDPIDYYRFTLTNPSGVTLNLSGLSADADLELSQDKDGDGVISSDEVIQLSEGTDNQDENINITALPAGDYFVKVSQYEGDTTYNLALTPTAATGVDLQVSVTPVTNSLTLGDQVSYTITVKNIGASNATGVTLSDNLPLENILDVSAVASKGTRSISSSAITANIGSLNVNESATVVVSGRLVGSGSTSSLIQVSSAQADFNPDNDSVVQRFNVAPGTIQPADLELSLTSDKTTANIDDLVTFKITLTNKGLGAATSIQVKNVLPQGLTLVSSNPQQGSYNSTSGIWEAGNIAKDNQAFVDIVTKVTSGGSLSNTAEVIAVAEPDPDSTPNNNNPNEDDQASVIVTIGTNENPSNQAPTDLALSATTVDENVPVNTVIGTFSSTDPDTGNNFTYSLIAGTGDTDNSAFSIVGNQLQINNSPDFETKNSYSIRVKTTDQGGLSFEKTLTIAVNDVNENPSNQAPTDLALSATTVNENVPVNTVIGTFSTTDPDTGNSFIYSLVTGTGDTDNSAFSIVGNQLQINNSPDFETKNSYSIRVKTTDQGGLSFEKTLTIVVNDVNETPSNQAPTALIFQNAVTELAENVNVTPEFKVADLLIEDDGLGTNNLFLTGRDRERFLIQNSALFYVGFTPNFEAQNSYEVTVNVDDTTVGVTPDLTQTLTLNITDVNEAPTALILANSTNTIAENTDTSQGVKVADIQISDDALGTNSLSLLGNDQSSFQIRGRELFFIGKADFEAQSLYNLTVAVTDTTLNPAPNATPDATVNFTLEITNLPDQDVNPQALEFKNTGNGQGSLVFNFSNLPSSIQVTAIEEGLQQTGAFFNNVVGLYPVADDNGAVFDSLDLDGDGNVTELIQPGQAGYARSALSQAVNNFILRASGEGVNQSTTAAEFGDVLLEGGRRYAPFVIANGGNLGESLQGSVQAFLTKNPDNVAATLENYISHEVAYFSFGSANPDGAEHLRSRGNNIFGFEDLPGNLPNISDNDFNDGILAFNFIA